MLRRTSIFPALLLAVSFSASADFDEDYEVRKWQEVEVSLPAAPAPQNLRAFFVSAATENRYFVDSATISVGGDGVVRYVLVIEAAGGARNVSFEGMRCETRERRIYATGRLDGRWAKSRNNAWEKIRDIPPGRHHAALFLEYFCPGGVIVDNAQEAVDAFSLGGHPRSRNW